MVLYWVRFRLDLDVPAVAGGPDPWRLLARALKQLLRCFGIKCRRVEEAPSPAAQGGSNPGELVDLTRQEAHARTPTAAPGERGGDGAGAKPRPGPGRGSGRVARPGANGGVSVERIVDKE